MRKTFLSCLKKAGLIQVRFHDLRHTFASWLIANGDSLAYVKDQMGHHSIQITVNTYGHLIPGANRQAVNRLAQMVENPQPIRNREEKKGAGGVEDHAHRPPCRICRKPGPRGRAACRSKIRTSLKSGETPYIPYRSAFQQPELHPLAPPCTTLRKIHRKVCGGPFSFLSARFLFPEVFSELLHGLSEFLPLPFFEGIFGLLE
ncbi:MAG: tyrosine-type recombinase/integrase [Candidatus Deferrimicrobiaceae bacterium]